MPRQAIPIREATEENPHTPYELKILNNRKWRANNTQHIAKYRQTYYQNNKERIKDYAKNFMREHYKNNPDIREQHNEQQKTKKKKDKEKAKQELTEADVEELVKVKEAKKRIRKMVSEVAYNSGLIQANTELEKQIKEQQDFINSIKTE